MSTVANTNGRHTPTSAGFRRSANVERDRDGNAASADFIITACARRSLSRVVEGLHRSSTQRAWTLTGPYGTGKSSFCLFAERLLAPGAASRRARESLSQVDAALAATLKAEFGATRGIVTVSVTGRREPLQATIARGCADALRRLRKPAASRLATELEAHTDGRQVASFLALVQRAMVCLTDETEGAHGCLLILDEMGKSLEFAAAHPELSDVYLLQQLAESASVKDSRCSLLGVLHQDFAGYARSLAPAQQQEWEKVRGRFEDIVFEQSAEDMLRLIAEALGRRDSAVTSDDRSYRRLWNDLLDHDVLPASRTQANLQPVLTSCAPLHPAVALLLGPVFKRFGQNERSAFSFLRSAEPFGLPEFLSRSAPGTLYRLVDLYQYLTGVFGDALLASRDGRRWSEAFNVESQHPDLSRAESDVLRTIALLTIIGRWHGLPATAELVIHSVGPELPRADAEAALQTLERKSAVVFRKFNKSFSLWEGSDIDVEAKIAEARAGQAGDTPTTHLLRGIFAPRPMVARRHSFERGTLRYFDIVPVSPELPGEAADAVSRSTADGHLFVLLNAMVERSGIEGLAIEGNPPERSIYLSVLRKLGLHQSEGDRWQFSTGPTGLDKSVRPVMKAIRRFLDESATEARSLDELFQLLRSPPFGLRDGVIPIIVCAALLAHEADVALYENGAFLPQLTKPTLERLVKDPASYAVRRWHVDGVRTVVFAQLAEMLGHSAVAGQVEQRDLLDVVKPLLRFVRRLNDFSRSTKTFSPTALAVRQALLDASEPDQLLFSHLPAACGLPPFDSRKQGAPGEVQHFRRTLQNALAELQKGYDTLLHTLLDELGSVLDNPPHPRGVRASLRQRAAAVTAFALNPELRVFSARLADASADDRAWIESIASFLSNKHPSQWIDEDRARLSVRLAQVASAFRSLEALALSRQQGAVHSADESIHLAVVGTAFPESKLVVHVGAADAPALAAIESQLHSVLNQHRSTPTRRLMIAALARVVQSALADSDLSPEETLV